MKFQDIFNRIERYKRNRYKFTQLRIDTQADEVSIFKLSLNSMDGYLKIAVVMNEPLEEYKLMIIFQDYQTQYSREFVYSSAKTLLGVLDVNIPLYFKDYYPTVKHKLLMSKEEYINMLPELAF